MHGFESSNEHERPVMSPIRRYYADIKHTNGSYAKMVTSLDEMIDTLPFRPDMNLDELIGGKLSLLEWQAENEPRIANEKLALLPLAYLGPQLEQSDCSAIVVRDWYNDTIAGIRSVAGDDHNDVCLESGNLEHQMCQKSTFCPWRTMEQYFSDELRNPDFTTDLYRDDPKRAYTIVTNKMTLAMRHNIILENYGVSLLASYGRDYQEHFDIDAP